MGVFPGRRSRVGERMRRDIAVSAWKAGSVLFILGALVPSTAMSGLILGPAQRLIYSQLRFINHGATSGSAMPTSSAVTGRQALVSEAPSGRGVCLLPRGWFTTR